MGYERCAMSSCPEESHAKVMWAGPSNRPQTAHFCKQHLDELFTQLKPLLQAAMGWVILDYPEKNEKHL